MRKWLKGSLAAFVLMFIVGATSVQAQEGEQYVGEFYQSANEWLTEDNTHFKKGSLDIYNPTVFEVDDPEGNFSTIVGAKVEYNSVRDEIFGFTHVETMYFNPADSTIVDKSLVSGFEPIKAFEEQYQGESGKFMHFTVIMLLLSLLVIVPVILMGIWAKNRYSTMEFATQNNVYRNHTTYV
ncbi:hypothetical protein G4V62_04325 [Bacillaceae bacterium SIJ1]|uniref:hypothetical protein n=1 Tax=Litoribacterium kuwaitense TaxID=1398745 RepID=UPI0013EAE995|nr:hypothetical protein [Litoribacterium kuwaitense]NGP44212.1 hypothetical protein [Litoribacterium kuwaitense]